MTCLCTSVKFPDGFGPTVNFSGFLLSLPTVIRTILKKNCVHMYVPAKIISVLNFAVTILNYCTCITIRRYRRNAADSHILMVVPPRSSNRAAMPLFT